MLVSVIIPCFNVESYIEACVNSVLNQTYPTIEIICVDNGSSDSTHQKLLALQSLFPNKISVLSEAKKGAPSARNKGLTNAKGEWIQFLDADDLILPEKIEHQMQIVINNPSIGFIASSFYNESIKGDRRLVNPNNNDPYKALFITKLGITSANLFKSEAIKQVGGWNAELKSSQEADLMFQMLKRGLTVKLDESPLTVIRERAHGQISQRNPKEKWIQYISLRIQIIDFLKETKARYFEEEKDFFYQNLFIHIRTLAKYEIDEATRLFYKYFDEDYTNGKKLPKSRYKLLFNVLGFKKTEILINLLKRNN